MGCRYLAGDYSAPYAWEYLVLWVFDLQAQIKRIKSLETTIYYAESRE